MSEQDSEHPQPTTFNEIGGSPSPAFTLRHVLRGYKDTGDRDQVWADIATAVEGRAKERT